MEDKYNLERYIGLECFVYDMGGEKSWVPEDSTVSTVRYTFQGLKDGVYAVAYIRKYFPTREVRESVMFFPQATTLLDFYKPIYTDQED